VTVVSAGELRINVSAASTLDGKVGREQTMRQVALRAFHSDEDRLITAMSNKAYILATKQVSMETNESRWRRNAYSMSFFSFVTT